MFFGNNVTNNPVHLAFNDCQEIWTFLCWQLDQQPHILDRPKSIGINQYTYLCCFCVVFQSLGLLRNIDFPPLHLDQQPHILARSKRPANFVATEPIV